jgi:hypothetical protein
MQQVMSEKALGSKSTAKEHMDQKTIFWVSLLKPQLPNTLWQSVCGIFVLASE